MMKDLLQYWPVAVVALNFVAVWINWSMRHAFASKKEVEDLRDTHAQFQLEVRGKLDNVPTRDAVQRLELATEKLNGKTDVLSERIKGEESLFKRVERQLEMVLKGHLFTGDKE